jgi:hypothetical protein
VNARPVAGGDDLLGGDGRVGERLLAEHVDPVPGGRDGVVPVNLIRTDNVDGADGSGAEQVFILVV